MKVLAVFDHPRRDSLSGAVLDEFLAGLAEAGHEAEVADLRAEGFDPAMPVEDDPYGPHRGEGYSETVRREQARIERNDAIAFIFPVWWWSFPAATKGWIDRVWNEDWAYGAKKLRHEKALLIGLAASSAEGFAKRGYDEAIRTQLVVGIMNFCGIETADIRLLHGTMDGDEARASHLKTARELGRSF